jgi:alpha-beta hydrolase superfamily lysophospholipase
MKHQEGKLTGARGLSIYYQYWMPEAAPKAVILIVHGAGEHSARYAGFASYFNEQGYAVAALDHPGHGKSEGHYGHVDSFDDFLETLSVFQAEVRKAFPHQPLVLLGHSLGGLISANYLLQHQEDFAACVLSGPAIKTDIEPPAFQLWLIGVLSRLLPRLGALQLDANGVSRDPAVVEDYVNDPLVNHGKMSARKVAELFRAMSHIQANAAAITLPMLILHGGDDAMTAPAGSQFLHDEISSSDKQLIIYPGLYHEIFNEPEREQVFQDLLQWLDARIA